MIKDLARVTKFEIIKDDPPFDPQKRFGVLLAATWNEEIKDWWERERKHSQHPEGIADKDKKGWRDLGNRLDKGDAPCFTYVLWKAKATEKVKKYRTFWALYAIIQIQT